MLDLNDKVDDVHELTAAEWNNRATELQNVVEDAGLTLDTSIPDADTHQLGKSISNQSSRINNFTDSGTSTAYVLTLSGSFQPPTDTGQGMLVSFVPGNTNTTDNPTVNVEGAGNKFVRRMEGERILAGDIRAGVMCVLIFQSTIFQLINPQSAPTPRGYMDGFLHSIGTDTEHDIDVAAGGRCRDSTNEVWIYSESAMTKQIDVNWAAGTDDGGIASGLGGVAVDTWYRFFVIWKDTDAALVDFGWDTSATATNLLADATGYTHYAQIAWHLTGDPANLIKYIQDPDDADYILWDVVRQDLDDTAPTVGSRTAHEVSAPPLSRAEVSVTVRAIAGTEDEKWLLITSLSQTATTPEELHHNVAIQRDTGDHAMQTTRLVLSVDADSEIGEEANSNTGVTIWFQTTGFFYKRGKA